MKINKLLNSVSKALFEQIKNRWMLTEELELEYSEQVVIDEDRVRELFNDEEDLPIKEFNILVKYGILSKRCIDDEIIYYTNFKFISEIASKYIDLKEDEKNENK